MVGQTYSGRVPYTKPSADSSSRIGRIRLLCCPPSWCRLASGRTNKRPRPLGGGSSNSPAAHGDAYGVVTLGDSISDGSGSILELAGKQRALGVDDRQVIDPCLRESWKMLRGHRSTV